MIIEENMIIHGERAIVKSFAKINLTLDVLGRLSDGYHEIESIMQTVNLYDLLTIDKAERGIYIHSNLNYLPTNEKNIAYKACEMFFKLVKIKGGAKIRIQKNIPVAAGLAGGSGNAAAVLIALNALYNTGLSSDELAAMGAKLGADVPYCLFGGTYLARGKGEILTCLPKLKKHIVLLAKPPINISTKSIYDYIDNVEIKERPQTDKITDAIEKDDFSGICEGLLNTMECATIELNPVIKGIKEKMMLNGATGALMSGSGPTVFGFFDDYDKAKKSHDSFMRLYKDVFLTHTI